MTVVRVFWLWPGVVLLGGCALVAGDRGSVVSVEDRPLTTASRSEPRAQVPRPTEVASLPTPPVASPLPAPEPVAVVATPLPSPQPPAVVEARPSGSVGAEGLTVASAAPAVREAGLPRASASQSKVVAALTTQANQQTRSGDLEQASATLERALRIEPDNPWLWHQLSLVRLFQHQDEQAAQLAARSNSLTADAALQARNWRVVAQARERTGDAEQASAAAARARALGGL